MNAAANDNGKPTRIELLRAADAILADHPRQKQPAVRVRYRGSRPVFNWLRKHDKAAAAALWLIARDRLPREAANDNQPAKGMGVDRRPSGKPRGKNPDPRSLAAYLALPSTERRLGDGEPEPARTGNWDAESRGITIKPQEWIHADAVFTEETCFSFHPPAIAHGAIFLGAIGGLGKPRPHRNRGDVRRVEEPSLPTPPDDVDKVIEVMLAGGNLADVGTALGAQGGYADRRGGAAVLAAGEWAKQALAA